MAETTKIAWCHHTANFWWGCEKVSPACAACYAEHWDRRTGGKHWGGRVPRRFIKSTVPNCRKWNEAAKHRDMVARFIEGEPCASTSLVASHFDWQFAHAQAVLDDLEAAGIVHPNRGNLGGYVHDEDTRLGRPRVFCMSMGDVFENYHGPVVDSKGLQLFVDSDGGWDKYVDDPIYIDDIRECIVWPTIRECDHLNFLLLTKRPENIRRMLPEDLRGRHNVWLGTTVESNAYTSRLDDLLSVPAVVHFVSAEPQLEEIDFRPWLVSDCQTCGGSGEIEDPQHPMHPSQTGDAADQTWCLDCDGNGTHWPLDWIITGGESKQGREHVPRPYNVEWARSIIRQCREYGAAAFVKQLGSRPVTVDDCPHREHWPHETSEVKLNHPKGEDPSEWPADLRVRQFPEPQPHEAPPCR